MKKKKLLAVLSLLIIAGLFAYFAYVGGAFLRLTPVTGKQFEQTALTLGFTKAAVDKSAISDKTGIANITVMMKSVKDDLHNVMIDILWSSMNSKMSLMPLITTTVFRQPCK